MVWFILAIILLLVGIGVTIYQAVANGAGAAAAYEIQVKADAEAEANRKLSQSLTDDLIEYKYYESWNGELPDTVGADTIIKMP